MEQLAALPWGTITPLGVLLLLIAYYTRLLLSGEMVPRAIHQHQLDERDATIAAQRKQINVLTEASKIDGETIGELTRQNSKLIDSGTVTDNVLRVIGQQAKGASADAG